MKRHFSLGFCLLISALYFGQETNNTDNIIRKKMSTIKSDVTPKIDGDISDEVWAKVPIATDFIERSPNNGKPSEQAFKTEVRILYNDLGLYVMMKMHDPEPSKIAKELTERDGISNDDFVGLTLNGYNDKQQSLEFVVTAAGVQYDAKLTTDGEDDSWNGVWHSEAKITEDGWTAEFMIPFSELRFPKKDVQEWGINLFRKYNVRMSFMTGISWITKRILTPYSMAF